MCIFSFRLATCVVCCYYYYGKWPSAPKNARLYSPTVKNSFILWLCKIHLHLIKFKLRKITAKTCGRAVTQWENFIVSSLSMFMSRTIVCPVQQQQLTLSSLRTPTPVARTVVSCKGVATPQLYRWSLSKKESNVHLLYLLPFHVIRRRKKKPFSHSKRKIQIASAYFSDLSKNRSNHPLWFCYDNYNTTSSYATTTDVDTQL